MAAQADRPAKPYAFLRQTIVQLTDRRWLGVFLLFLLFLGGTNAMLALAKPAAGATPGLSFVLAGLLRVVAVVSISVAALRIATDSPRGRWVPDGAYFLYFLLGMLAFGAGAFGAALGARLPAIQRLFVVELVAIILIAPFARWLVAAAIERPLPLSPMPYLRRFGAWLPSYLLWSLVLILPLASTHGFLTLRLLETAGRPGFWLTAAADALASALLVLLMLALRLTAYRSVARS
jgi:hypothetical protein